LQKLSATSHFSNDLGLDSLDTVEVVMAIEEVRHDCGHNKQQKRLIVLRSSALRFPTRRRMRFTAVSLDKDMHTRILY